ncbi:MULTISPECIES: sigma-70 family RNA polymerase sigma factor [Streptomyces]|uniref:sigma-70 family RNA polymerase sigma factor n=1 Tax=Streptomyces TaxID=1883 RepID=UPI001E2DC136|nr:MULTISPECIES: sigma-70 family RNA polymerase sigma factor [Streptomyces]UFQ13591.1 sigma-70 family RNA polymerase sigma factor [Streptomyces huasconensis]WCL83188.1 sigma-70 family RNA polymerase sigma factor [Streptomyces sp. JCM 35825]
MGLGLMDADHVRLVVAAQRGDERAREELVSAYLPLLYNIVGRALSGHADVDDVVQETLLRAVRDLPALRAPESFRSWLVSITLRQVNTYWQRQRTLADRTTLLDEALPVPDTTAPLEDTTILRLRMSDERGQAVEASRWLDPEHRVLLSLWWQECAGLLSRQDIADATGLGVSHTGVRLQRMREQLELSRTIVTALAADPRCPGLSATVSGWDGARTSVWRKRIARHTRDCATCTATAADRVPAELLLSGLTPLAVPTALLGALVAKGLLSGMTATTVTTAAATASATGTSAGGGALLGKLHAVAAHPIATLATGAVLVTGAATYVAWPEPEPRAPGVAAAPTAGTTTWATQTPSATQAPSATPAPSTTPAPSVTPSPSDPAVVPLGVRSLESVDRPGQFLTYEGDFATLSSGAATFTVSKGLADSRCVTFRAPDGRYLRHHYLRLRLSADDGSQLFREDATFCPRPGTVDGSVTLHAHNYPGSALRPRDGSIRLDGFNGTRTFTGQASFVVRAPQR